MFCIPPLKLAVWHFDELVCDGTIFLVDDTLLADGISLPFRNPVNPEDIIHSAEENSGDPSADVGEERLSITYIPIPATQ